MANKLNIEQARGLANFYFDIAKGIVLGTVGTSIAIQKLPLALRVSNIFLGAVLSYICIRIALSILEE